MKRKTICLLLILILCTALFSCKDQSDKSPMPMDQETLKALSEEYAPGLIFEERERSDERVNFVLKGSENAGSDLLGAVMGQKGGEKLVNISFTAGGNTYNNEYLNSVAVTPEDIGPTLTYATKLFGLENADDLTNAFTSEFPGKNTEMKKEDGKYKYTYETKINDIQLRIRFNHPENSEVNALLSLAISTDLSEFGL